MGLRSVVDSSLRGLRFNGPWGRSGTRWRSFDRSVSQTAAPNRTCSFPASGSPQGFVGVVLSCQILLGHGDGIVEPR